MEFRYEMYSWRVAVRPIQDAVEAAVSAEDTSLLYVDTQDILHPHLYTI